MKKIAAFAVIIMSCNAKVSEEKLNHEAITLHNSMVQKSNMIAHRLNEIKNDTAVNQDSVTVLIQLLAQWKNDLVEVPGNEHHGHDHHHQHSPPDVTAEQMLEIQKDLDMRLGNIGKRAAQLKPHDQTPH